MTPHPFPPPVRAALAVAPQDTRNIFALAALLSTGFAAIGVIGEWLGVVAYSLLPAALCGVMGALLSLTGYLLAPRRVALIRPILAGYVLTATLAIHFAGGPQSFLMALYIGITIAAALLIGRRGAVGIALLSAACFSILIGLEFAGVIPIYPIWDADLSLDDRRVVLSGLIFSVIAPTLGVAYVAGSLADRLARRTAEQSALALIARDIASSLNPDEVIRTVLKRAMEHTRSDRGGIYLYDAERRRMVEAATINMPGGLEETGGDGSAAHLPPSGGSTALPAPPAPVRGFGRGLRPTRRRGLFRRAGLTTSLPSEAVSGGWSGEAEGGVISRVLRSGRTVRLGALRVRRDPDALRAGDPGGRPSRSPPRSQLCVPILHNSRVEGVINLESNRLRAYTEAHQGFVEQLAQHAAIALNNARLYAKTERNLYDVARANLEIRALQESLSAVQSTLELDAVLQRICDAVVLLGYDLATLAIADRSAAKLAIRAVAAADAGLIRSLESILGIPLVGLRTKLRRLRNIGAQALAERRVLVSSHTVDFLYPIASRGPRSTAFETVGLRIGAAIPLVVRQEGLGILYAFSRKSELTDMDLSSLQAFGAQAAVALDKANLFEEARTVRDRLQAVLDATHDGLILYNAQSCMVLTNRAAEQLLGLPLASYLGKPMAAVLDRSGLLDRLYPNVNPAERQAIIDTEVNTMMSGLRDGTSEVARRLITLPGAETRYVEEFTLRVLDEGGRLIGRLAVLHDVTDQKQLEADRDAFTQMLIHDLRSPLSAIIGGLQLIELGIQEGDPPDLLLKSDRVALASAHRLLDLIGSLLDVQKLETGQIELQLQPLAPAALIQDALDTLRPLADTSDITLEVSADSSLPVVQGDAEHMRRVLINLMDNALKFVGSGGRIRVSAAADGKFVRFSVADNGPGIPADYRERIFERYVQVPGRSGRRRGSGLGLTYCKRVVETHGGKIWVEESPEGGSDFIFTLPVADG